MRFAQKFIKIYIKIEQILVIPPTGFVVNSVFNLVEYENSRIASGAVREL